ncbi:nucleotidyltransferase family protein [candidate division KSB1 bacterium]|nr:nucleotidyltransferase family protein [candidate division KSB1 bacterium]
MNFTHDQQFVLQYIGLHFCPESDDKIGEMLNRQLEWQRIKSYAIEQGVAPVMYKQLNRLQSEFAFPADIINELKSHYLNAFGRNIAVFEELKRVVSLLSNAGIDAVVLKRPALIEQVYHDCGVR